MVKQWLWVPVCFELLTCEAAVAAGRYLILHRLSGKYLHQDLSLGDLQGADLVWTIDELEGGKYSVAHASSAQPLAQTSSWQVSQLCRGSSVAFVSGERALAGEDKGLGWRASLVEASIAQESGLHAWVLLSPCRSEDLKASVPPECFPQGSDWSQGKEDCCDTQKHGPTGNPTCFDFHYTFERCCPEVAFSQSRSSPLALDEAVPRILCSGERLQGDQVFVRMAEFDGDRRWTHSAELARGAKFDFAPEDPTSLDGPAVKVLIGLPSCGGPALFEVATGVLPASEHHQVKILQDLHKALISLSQRRRSTAEGKGVHPTTYLPFFPHLLMVLHRRTGDPKHLQCIGRTVAALSQVPEWRRNAGYDFVIPLGYDRPWERRLMPADPTLTGEEARIAEIVTAAKLEDAYGLETYDPRLGNVLLLATHNLFFGDRQSLFIPNSGGAGYRNLRNIVVPLPFTLNCTSWRQALTTRRQPGWTPRFHVSFVGSGSGATRDLLRKAWHYLSTRLPELANKLAIRFVLTDEERLALSLDSKGVLSGWFGPGVDSFDTLLRQSGFCLVMPGDVSDLAYRFLHSVSVGCTPVVIGGPGQTIPPPFPEFIAYQRFARFERINDISDAQNLLLDLVREAVPEPSLPGLRGAEGELLAEISGLYSKHVGCGFQSGTPFLAHLERSLQARAAVWRHIRWFN